jgi:integrase
MIDETNGAWALTEVKSLLAVTREKDYSFYVLLLISILHGLRVSEAINLRKQNFVMIRGELRLRVQRLKGSLETTQSLYHDSDSLLNESDVVQRYIFNLRTSDFLFPQKGKEHLDRFSADRRVKTYCALAGIDAARAHAHCAKHTLGASMRHAGRPIEEIAKALGHANINNTYRAYMGVRDEDADRARTATFAFAAASGFTKCPH